MTCEKIENQLSSYLENELSSTEKAEVENHLKICDNCSTLLSFIKETRASLAAFPELEPGKELLSRLYAIPSQKKKFRFSLDFLLRPSLQPVFALASVFLIFFSLYFFNPDRKYINQAISRQFHRSYSQIEKLYAKAGTLTDNLGAYKDDFLVSLKKINVLSRNED